MKTEEYKIRVNGSVHSIRALPDTPLLWILRDHLHLTGTKYGCGVGQCGNCMIVINQKSHRSCQVAINRLASTDEIITIEALNDEVMALLRNCWIENNAPQCGYCQSGMLIKAWEMLNDASPYDESILIQIFDRMLCRCGTYNRIKAAIQLAYVKQGRGT